MTDNAEEELRERMRLADELTKKIEQELRERERLLKIALGAYNAVWQSWPALNAETVDECRHVAMAAALGAILDGKNDR